jgi:hypothetical protein
MSHRHDIFVKQTPGDYGSEWGLYCAAVLPSQSIRIAGALEAQGETVRIMAHDNVGRLVYETPPANGPQTRFYHVDGVKP